MSGALDGVKLHVVRTLDDALACKRWAFERREGPLGFDTESGGLSPHKDRHRLTQLGDLQHGWAIPPAWFGVANEILREYPGWLAAHNMPYDWRVLAVHQGLVPAWERTHDTLLGGHIVNSVRTAALKPRAAIEIDPRAMAGEKVLADAMHQQGWNWDTVPETFEPWQLYGALDPVLTCHLLARFEPELRKHSDSYMLELATARICANEMLAGMMIDRPFIEAKIAELRQFHDVAMPWLKQHYGITSVNSNEQVGHALNKAGVPTLLLTDGGKPAIGKGALKFYAEAFPHAAELIRGIARCRKTGDMITKYLAKFLLMAGSDDIMHYQIWTSRARTGRMSVTDPPMQTYDRDEPAIRGAYIPRPGHVFISVDADQIEARIAAHLTRDRQLISDLLAADESGQKFFVIMASQIYGETISKSEPRYTWTKNTFYAQQYGSGLDKAAKTADIPVDRMRPVYMGIQRRYPQRQAYMNQLIKDAKAMKIPSCQTLGGRELRADRGHEYALFNYQDQGSSAEVLKQGQVALDRAGYGPLLRLPVHDEFLLECPAEDARDVLHDVSKILTNTTDYVVPITWSGNILEERWVKT
jgi:DNA polymerase I